MITYATLAQLRAENKSVATTDDELLLDVARRITAAIDAYVARRWRATWFVPRMGTWRYDACPGPISSDGRTLSLATHYVTIDAVVDADGASLIDGTDYYALPRDVTPITALRRMGGALWVPSARADDAMISVTGARCYREHYGEAWEDATALGGNLSDSATTITVVTTTKLSPGMLIRIDSEWLVVLSGAGTTWTVQRGARGSTAAAHLTGAAVARFLPDPVVVQATCRWAGLVFARRGAYEQTTFDGTATVQFPTAMPTEVAELLRSGGWAVVRPVLV